LGGVADDCGFGGFVDQAGLEKVLSGIGHAADVRPVVLPNFRRVAAAALGDRAAVGVDGFSSGGLGASVLAFNDSVAVNVRVAGVAEAISVA